jgi:hypothetical protein
MANPSIQFAKLDLSNANALIYSTASNFNSFIRINGNFTSGSTTVTNVDNFSYPTYFGTSSILPGMYLAAATNNPAFTRIVSWDNNTKTIELASPASVTGTVRQSRIAPSKGMYFVKSGSISKTGTGNPQNWTTVTGSEDPNYTAGSLTWGVAAQLAPLSTPASGITGDYGQYVITKITDRIGTAYANFFLTASNTIPSLQEASDKTIQIPQGSFLLSQIYNNTITIASAGDSGVSQGYGLAGYQTGMVSFASQSSGTGAGFPFTGSADITGSLQVTGSSTFAAQVGGTDFFIIKSGSVNPVKFNGEGIMQFADTNFNPTSVAGGIYYSASQWFLGVE